MSCVRSIPWMLLVVDRPGSVLFSLRQYAAVKRTNTLNISRRPNSIANVQIQVCASVRPEKLTEGPTFPMPGPMLLIEPITAETDETKSRPVTSSANDRITIVMKYNTMNARTE